VGRKTPRKENDKPLRFGLRTFRELMELERQLGASGFAKRVPPDVLREYRTAKREWQTTNAKLMESIRELNKIFKLAKKEGDPNLVQWALRGWPIETIRDKGISRHLESRIGSSSQKDRDYLEGAAKAFRQGLLEPHPGRPRRIDRGMLPLVDVLQEAFEQAPVKIKRTYRNPAARRMDISELAEHVSHHMPLKLQDRTLKAVKDVISSHPQIRRTFGVEVAAKLFRCSSRHIRSLRKSR
jgi:hypothetical protein